MEGEDSQKVVLTIMRDFRLTCVILMLTSMPLFDLLVFLLRFSWGLKDLEP